MYKAPVTALAIFGGAYLPKKQDIAITLLGRFISDIFLGFFSRPLMVAVYASHLAGVLFGLWIKKIDNVIPEFSPKGIISRKYPESSSQILDHGSRRHSAGMTSKWVKIVASSLVASIIFFLVTNFAFFTAVTPTTSAALH